MRTIFCGWCLFLVLIYFIFAVVSSVSSQAESTATPEAPTTPISTSSSILSSAPTPTTTVPTTTVTTTTLPTTITPLLPPAPPSDVYVTPVKPKGLNVWWTPSPNDTVQYSVSVNNYHHTPQQYTDGSNCMLENLPGGSFYVIGVQACFQGNICSYATEGRNHTYPSMPGNLQLVNQSVSSFGIKWEQNGGFDDFNVIVKYHSRLNVTHNITINPRQSGDSNLTVVWCGISDLSTSGGNYTVQVAAIYQGLQSDFQNNSFLTKPDQPQNVALVNRTVDSLSIRWTQYGVVESFSWSINDTGAPQSGTLPQSYNGSFADCYPCHWPMNLDIRNLTIPGEIYLIEIYATVPTVSSDPFTHSYVTVPPPLANIICTGQTTATLSIQLTVTASYRIDGYFVSCSPVISYGANVTRIYLEGNLTVVDLTAGLMYTVEARTMSYLVHGDPVKTNCSTIPNVPKDFSSTTGTSEMINLSWKKPVGHHESYKLVYANDSSNDNSEINVPPGEVTTYNLTGLSSDSNYTIKIRTLSFNQMSEYETTSSWTLSDKVTEVRTSAKQTSVDVEWKSPLREKNVFLYNLNISDAIHCVKLVNLCCKNRALSPSCASFTNRTDILCESGKMSYTFSDLKHSTNYSLTIAAVNPGGSSQSHGIYFVTGSFLATNYDWVAGVVIGCFFGVILIIAMVILFLRWRQSQPPFSSKKQSSTLDSIGGEENPTYEDEPEPVAVDAFNDHVMKMSQDSNYLYACEYMLLAKLSPKNSTVAAELPDNRSKNRYTDILPFDHSRVKLIPEEDVGEGDSSDYINASFLPGFNSKREYIAAQGPMRSTVDDFWLMIWQQKVSMVVMVTNLSERGREKCEQYWPDDSEPLCYGNITVQLKSEMPQDFYTIRTLEVSCESEKRQLFQYHFLTWPDFGIPEDIEHILTFVRDIRDSIKGTAPLLVHCSAGVGRTGTFIVVDHLLQLIKNEQWIDLFHIVLELRQHRPKMIQAESQYVFAHECIKVAIEKGLHRASALNIAEDEQANGECLYVNASETVNDSQLYANASEIHEQAV